MKKGKLTRLQSFLVQLERFWANLEAGNTQPFFYFDAQVVVVNCFCGRLDPRSGRLTSSDDGSNTDE